jgi:hypothetical protein
MSYEIVSVTNEITANQMIRLITHNHEYENLMRNWGRNYRSLLLEGFVNANKTRLLIGDDHLWTFVPNGQDVTDSVFKHFGIGE